MSATEFAAIVAGISGIIALTLQFAKLIKDKRREQTEVEEALDHQPAIRQQLELGNFGAAIEHLNKIIVGQAKHIDRQDEIIREQGNLIDSLTTENRSLRDKVDSQDKQLDRCSERLGILSEQLNKLRRQYGNAEPGLS